MRVLKSVFQIRFWAVAFAGALFALVVWSIMALQWQHVLAISVAIVFLSVVMMGLYRINDILIYAFVFNIPFAVFDKCFLQPVELAHGVVNHGIRVGMAELLILLAYTVWFAQIFIARKRPLPKLGKMDFFIFLLFMTQFISMLGAPDKRYAFFAIIYNIKHVLIYFFIAHTVERRHLKMIVILLSFAILLESGIACFERVTGHIGIGRTKGNIAFGTQGKVPGIEEAVRAAGTTDDPHTLGLYFSMLLPIPFVLAMIRFLRPVLRLLLTFVLIIGIMGLVVTFSRSGWLSFGIAATFALGVILFSWKEGKSIVIVLAVVVFVSLLYPSTYEHLIVRLFESPYELLQTRFDMNWTALGVWRQHFFFGYGPSNYPNVLTDPSVTVYGYSGDLVHNMFLQIAAESGLFGVVSFFGIVFLVMARCWKLLKCEDRFIRALALGILTAFFAFLLDGLTNPMYKAPVPYAQFWTYVAIGISLGRLLKERGGDPAMNSLSE